MSQAPLGIGVDVVALDRMKDALDTSGEVFARKVFTPYERQQAEKQASPVTYLAMTFAAKEAIFKTLGIGWGSGVEFSQVEIRQGPHGEPYAVLRGRFAEVASERGVARVLLSLSSDDGVAVAVALGFGA